MQASDVMSAPVFVVSPTENVAYARNLMLKHHMSRVPVMDAGCLVGILTKKDIAYRLRQSEPIWRRRPIDRIPIHVLMVPDPITIGSTTSIREAAHLMITHDISGLPVEDDGDVVGIVTKSDMMKSTAVQNLKMTVGDLMSDVLTVNRYHSLDHVIDLMSERNDKIVVVNDSGSTAGIITESNIAFFEFMGAEPGVPEKDVMMLRKSEAGGRKWFRDIMHVSAVAEDVMSKPVIVIASDQPLGDAVRLMRDHQITTVVVQDGDELKGILKRDDIIREIAK